MEIKFRQKRIGWCTVYTWANLLNECGVLKYCEDEKFKGCTSDEENEIIATFCPAVKLQLVAYTNTAYDGLPIDYIWDAIQKVDDEITFDEQVVIYTLSVRLIKSIWHHTAIVKYNNEFWYLDPLREFWFQIYSKEHLADQFIDCCQIQRPVHIASNKFASFNGTLLQYPFLQSQLA